MDENVVGHGMEFADIFESGTIDPASIHFRLNKQN